MKSEGLPEHFNARPEALTMILLARVECAERLVDATGVDILHSDTSAYYAQGPDHIQTSPFETFKDA